MMIKSYIKLVRVKHWIKNLYLFIPVFFAGQMLNFQNLIEVTYGFISFSLVASSVYILNDIIDVKFDRLHPVKRMRPIASGEISKRTGYLLFSLFLLGGLLLAYQTKPKFLFILIIYFLLNLVYSFWLKRASIIDVVIISIGFVLRVKSGGVLAQVGVSEWLVVMIFLLSLFMALAKRYDDVRIREDKKLNMRDSVKMYNHDFLNTSLSMIAAIIIVSYILYTLDINIQKQFGTYRLYYTSLFVVIGILRYLQIIFLSKTSGSPTKILLKDKYIQLTILLWVLSFYVIIYIPEFDFFNSN